MKSLYLATLKFCTTNQLFKSSYCLEKDFRVIALEKDFFNLEMLAICCLEKDESVSFSELCPVCNVVWQ